MAGRQGERWDGGGLQGAAGSRGRDNRGILRVWRGARVDSVRRWGATRCGVGAHVPRAGNGAAGAAAGSSPGRRAPEDQGGRVDSGAHAHRVGRAEGPAHEWVAACAHVPLWHTAFIVASVHARVCCVCTCMQCTCLPYVACAPACTRVHIMLRLRTAPCPAHARPPLCVQARSTPRWRRSASCRAK